MWIKRGSKTEYLEFINKIDADIVDNPLSGLNKKAWIRHDVDKDLDHAIKFAEYEFKNNIKSTYFLLHTASYWDWSIEVSNNIKSLKDKISYLYNDLHRGIGFHNDIMSTLDGDMENSLDLTISVEIDDILKFLRSTGAPVLGTSCHGAREHYNKDKTNYGWAPYFNYQIWHEWSEDKNEGFMVRWAQVYLKDFGLQYEAYFLPYTHMFSDSGNNWIGYAVDGQKPFERTALESPNNLGSNVIEEFNKCREGFLQVLTHPCHWEEVK